MGKLDDSTWLFLVVTSFVAGALIGYHMADRQRDESNKHLRYALQICIKDSAIPRTADAMLECIGKELIQEQETN